jgi:hypothetical protein
MAAVSTPFADKAMSIRERATAKAVNTITLNKKSLTLKKGKTTTLKATLSPVNKNVKITWESSNTKVAKVSSSGKVTAIAPGTVWIVANAKNYNGMDDGAGLSDRCMVSVEGSSKDPKPLGANDRTFYYNSKKIKAPEWSKDINYYIPLMSMAAIIGDECDAYEDYADDALYIGMMYFDADSMFHTDICFAMNGETSEQYGFGYYAAGTSPIKTYRGLKVGGTKSAVEKAYGLPTRITAYKDDEGRSCEDYFYQSYIVKSGKALYMNMTFTFQKSKAGFLTMRYYYGLRY